MSARVPASYRRLGVGAAGASKTDLRRAYARRLKLINPDTDRAAFEALRADYEAALAEFEARGQSIAPIPAADPEGPGAAPEPAAPRDPVVFPAPDGDPGLDPAAEAEAEALALARRATSEALGRLEARLWQGERDGTEIAMIEAILRDPALSDPEVADNVEAWLYHFFLARIETGSDGLSQFRVARPGRKDHAGDLLFHGKPEALAALTRQLDRQFGWFSDGVRMARSFPDYRRFVDAAAALTPERSFRKRLGRLSRLGGVGLWVICMVIAGGLRLFSELSHPPRPLIDKDPAVAISHQVNEIYQDINFLRPLPGVTQPSAITRQFLRDLLREQRLVGAEDIGPMLLKLHLGLASYASGDFTPAAFGTGRDADRLRYLFGTLLAARYTVQANLGYLDVSFFHLRRDAERQLWFWSQLSFDPEAPTLWPGGGGYALVRSEAVRASTVPVYPEPFLREIWQAARGDAHLLEGALGLSFDAFARSPDLRLHFHPQVSFPRVERVPLVPARHALALTGLAQNRRPLRVMQNTTPKCDWPAARLLGDPGFDFRCD